MKVIFAGDVDHGKSTLIGRLLYDTNFVSEDKKREVKKACEERRMEDLEWSFFLDCFQAERDQSITIDTTQVQFSSEQRDYVVIDGPGHKEFIKNMVSGASQADVAVLVIDAVKGVQEQTHRHVSLLSLLGITHVIVAVNKMDAAAYSQEAFQKTCVEIKNATGLDACAIVPLSARTGEMVAETGNNMNWYGGKTLLAELDALPDLKSFDDQLLRFGIQDVYTQKDKSIIVGRVESGSLSKGDRLLFWPSGQEAGIESLEVWPSDGEKIKAGAGEVLGLTLERKIDIERGGIAFDAKQPPQQSTELHGRMFWLSEKLPLIGSAYKMRFGTGEVDVELSRSETFKATSLMDVILKASTSVPLNPCGEKVVLCENDKIVGGGMINVRRKAEGEVIKADHHVGNYARAEKNGHKGGVFWFTGLSGAGKTTLAMAVEKELFDRGCNVYVLDGDNLRSGLNSDLGFSPEERTENIRRAAEVAALMADAGLIVISAFISPYKQDREGARETAYDCFHEIYIKAGIATCEQRDPKGLYKKARAGMILEFTGIDAPYEEPDKPEAVINTEAYDIDTCVKHILGYIQSQVIIEETVIITKEKALVL